MSFDQQGLLIFKCIFSLPCDDVLMYVFSLPNIDIYFRVRLFFVLDMKKQSYSPLNKSEQTQQNLQQPNPSQAQTKPKVCSSSCCVHVFYIIIISILLWLVFDLSERQKRLEQNQIESKTTFSQLQGQIANELSLKWEKMSEKEGQLQKRMQASSIKADHVYETSMEQHYLNKAQKFKQLAKNQKFLQEDAKARTSFLLSLNNYKLVHQNIYIKRQIQELLRNEYSRLSKTHNFSLPQKPFCIVVPTFNNGKDYRYEYNLRSIFNQNYSNYKVVIIDDASTDRNYQLILQYLQKNKVAQKVHLVKNKERMTALPNIYLAATQYCQSEDIMALVDGDDELLGVNALKVFNSLYTANNLDVLYSNLVINQKNSVKKGWSSGYSEEQKRKNVYRDSSTKMFPLRSFKVSTFLKINPSDFKQDSGQWFRSASDQTICPQVLQLSCGKNDYVDEYFYLYNFGIGSNDIEINGMLNSFVISRVRGRKKYQCSK